MSFPTPAHFFVVIYYSRWHHQYFRLLICNVGFITDSSSHSTSILSARAFGSTLKICPESHPFALPCLIVDFGQGLLVGCFAATLALYDQFSSQRSVIFEKCQIMSAAQHSSLCVASRPTYRETQIPVCGAQSGSVCVSDAIIISKPSSSF